MKKLGNISSSVMQQRNSPRNDGLDDFPTPPWGTRALIEHVLTPGAHRPQEWFCEWSVWEPACNRGYMARPLSEYFQNVLATDIKHYGWGGQSLVDDFLWPAAGPVQHDWIITNPPFRLAADFAKRCLALEPREGFALLVRTSFLEGAARFEELFSRNPPSTIAQFVERLPMVEGRYDPHASTATSYCWLVWDRVEADTEFVWIPPCRRQLERPSDTALEEVYG
jgi:hypothetical protein